MPRPEVIRPQFLEAYCVRDRNAWQERHEAIRASEDAVRALNQEFGVENSASCLPNQKPQYVDRYKEIQLHHRPIYNAISQHENEWKLKSDITIPEYLYIDNFASELSHAIAKESFSNLFYDRFLEIKSSILIEKWKTHRSPFIPLWEQRNPNVGEVLARVEGEITLFKYARKRCADHFSLRIWDIESNKQIECYKNAYAKALRYSYYGAIFA